MTCDLHIHSYYSDGSFSPAQIIAHAKQQHLIVALTDHNTVAGLPEFMAQAKEQGVIAVPGVELTTAYEGKELHLLGLFLASQYYDQLEQMMQNYHRQKKISNRQLIDRLCGAGYIISYADVSKYSHNDNINRAHIAAALIEKKYVASIEEAFSTLLSEESGFYIPARRMSVLEGIALLRSMRVLPVLAHPLKDMTIKELEMLLPKAIKAGLIGMETCHSSYDRTMAETAERLTEKYGIQSSGGSDFHGKIKPDIALGQGNIPCSVYENLLAIYQGQ